MSEELPRLFVVELRTVAVVLATSAHEATEIADDNWRDIVRDCGDMEIDVLREANTIRDVTNHGWDGRCLPYGGDGNTTIDEVLKEIADRPPVAERCTRTLELPL
jgi:hypothetical protein